MRAQLAAFLSAVLITISFTAKAEVFSLDTPKTSMALGSALLVYDVYKVQVSKARLAEAQARLASSSAYREFIATQREHAALNEEMGRMFGETRAAAAKRLKELEEKGLAAVRRMLDRDVVRFDLLDARAALTEKIESSRAKALAKIEAEQKGTKAISKVRRLGGLGLLVGGTLFAYLTVTEFGPNLSPSKVFDMLPQLQKKQIVTELEQIYYTGPAPRTLEDLFRDHP